MPTQMTASETTFSVDRFCLREPIPEIADAARYLDAAVSAHLAGHNELAGSLIRLADMPVIREWTESLWGTSSPHVQRRIVAGAPPSLPEDQRIAVRMPTPAEERYLHQRDGYHCRFCGIPVIRATIRKAMRLAYPDALPWGRTNQSQHAGFQALWATYDHVLPHSRGGDNDAENVVIACQPCNCARWHYTLEEVGLSDPRAREPVRSTWDGLERFLRLPMSLTVH
jgi:5-methylcytosine-specific restriction endonuclease McrA